MKMRRKTIPDTRCSVVKRAVCDLRRRRATAEEELKKMMNVERFGIDC
jgi:hypothetical protein